MLSTLKKANPYSTFPLDLQETFNEKQEKLEIYVKIKDGEKIGKSNIKI